MAPLKYARWDEYEVGVTKELAGAFLYFSVVSILTSGAGEFGNARLAYTNHLHEPM
jgi:hypothetical protein